MSSGQDLRARYARAATLTPDGISALMRNRSIDPQWTGGGDTFWYQRQCEDDAASDEYVLVDPVAATRTVVQSFEELGLSPAEGGAVPGVLPSPDGKGGLIVCDHDLWAVNVAGEERRLTTTGEPAFGWGELVENNNMNVPFKRMGVKLPPVGTVYSPSGRYVLTTRVDQRSMTPRQMVEQVSPSGKARPITHELRVQLDDEGEPPPGEGLIVDLTTGAAVVVDMRDGLASGLMTNGSREAHWRHDEAAVYVLKHRMGGATLSLIEIGTTTGELRELVTLDEPPLYEPNQFLYSLPLWHVLSSGEEAILFSQRDGWGHLYLYDLSTGQCRHAISSGELVVRDLLRVDEQRREVTFVAGSAGGGHNPYWRKVYRASLDGDRQVLLTPEPADHEVYAPQPDFFHLVFGEGKPQPSGFSPSGRFFVDHQSTVSEAPIILLRDADRGGEIVLELERADVSRLEAAGYVTPEQFCVKADDGVTDLWGVLGWPSSPVDGARIPVIEYIYAGFQIACQPSSYVGGRKTATNQAWFPMFNELGFATVIVDGRGTPGRHRDFRQWTHRHGHTSRGLDDHPHAITELAKTFPMLDLDRVGAIGHSYGGYNTARVMLMFPEFYKVGVSSAGVHEAAKSPYDAWSWFMGAGYDRSSTSYAELGNLHLVDRLTGHLLLLAGEIDENATLDHTYALVNALIKAGKRFDLKIWPGFNHYQLGSYFFMTCWDYFERHLLGEGPPPK
jgi:dipeptidyl-peptidase 4